MARNPYVTIDHVLGQISEPISPETQTLIDSIATGFSAGIIDVGKLTAHSPNLLTNFDSFEQFYNKTLLGASSNIVVSKVINTRKFHGENSLEVECSTGGVGYKYINPYTSSAADWIDINEGGSYIFSYYIYTTSNTSINGSVDLYSYGAATTLASATFDGVKESDGWVRKFVKFTIDPGPATSTIKININTAGATIYLDAVQLEKSENDNPSPFGAGGQTVIEGGNITTNSITSDSIQTNSIVADKIAANTINAVHMNSVFGDFNKLLTVGSGANVIYINGAAAPARIYTGDGVHSATNTGFYIDDDGKFSLKNQLVFTPSGGGEEFAQLNIAGKIRGAFESQTLIPSDRIAASVSQINTTTNITTMITGTHTFLKNESVVVYNTATNINNLAFTIVNIPNATSIQINTTGYVVPNATGLTGSVALREVTMGLHPAEGAGTTWEHLAGTGLRLDDKNWWFTNGQWRVGTGSSYLKWDGAKFKISGSGTKTLEMSIGSEDSKNYYSIVNAGNTPTFNAVNTPFYVDSTGNFSLGQKLTWDSSVLNIEGSINATAGTIGGFTIGSTVLNAGTGTSAVGVSSGEYTFYAGNATAASAPFRVANNGAFYASSGSITGSVSIGSSVLTLGGKNYLKNSTFSNGFTNWTVSGAVLDTIGVSDLNSAKIVGALATTKYFYQNLALSPVPAAGSKLTMSCVVKRDSIVYGSTNPFVRLYATVQYTDATTEYPPSGMVTEGTGDWQTISAVITLNASKTFQSISVYGYGRDFTGTVWFDDFKLEIGNKNSEWTPAEGELSGAKYLFDGSGATFYNGGLTIQNAAGSNVFTADVNGNLILTGNISATAGSIGGFTIGTTSLNSSDNTVGMSPGLAAGTANYSFWTGNSNPALAPFSVTNTGVINAASGLIGAWTITANSINSADAGMTVAGTAGTNVVRFFAGANWANRNTAEFRVSGTGFLTATNANITGTITSTAGSIAGWTLNTTHITGTNISLNSAGRLQFNTAYLYSAGGGITHNATISLFTGGVTIDGVLSVNNTVFPNQIGTSSVRCGTIYHTNLDASGTLTAVAAYSRAVTANTPRTMVINSTGAIGTTASTRRFKTNIEPYDFNYNALMNLPIVSFEFLPEKGGDGSRTQGTIAEEAEALGLSEFIGYDEHGLPDYFAYEKLPIALVQVAQKQHKYITQLEARIASLEAKLNATS